MENLEMRRAKIKKKIWKNFLAQAKLRILLKRVNLTFHSHRSCSLGQFPLLEDKPGIGFSWPLSHSFVEIFCGSQTQ